jgi:hypothetical protein
MALALLAAPAAAQDQARYAKALAAGYKASFLCSDIFNGGMSEAQVERDDLQRTYDELVPLMRAQKAVIDRQARTVSVAFDDQMPPRVAAWRPYLGCAQLPDRPPAGTRGASAARRPAAQANMDRSLAEGDAGRWRPRRRKALRARWRRLSIADLRAGQRDTACWWCRTGIVPNATATTSTCTVAAHLSVAKSLAGNSDRGRRASAADRSHRAPGARMDEGGRPCGRRSRPISLLRMASGPHSDTAGNRTDAIYFGGTASPSRRQAGR